MLAFRCQDLVFNKEVGLKSRTWGTASCRKDPAAGRRGVRRAGSALDPGVLAESGAQLRETGSFSGPAGPGATKCGQ